MGGGVITLQEDEYRMSNVKVQVNFGSGSVLGQGQGGGHHHHGKRSSRFPAAASYFGVESLCLLVFLTVSLLILPLILPPLPPPPLMLLVLPICILGVLMMLAFTPPHVRAAATSACFKKDQQFC